MEKYAGLEKSKISSLKEVRTRENPSFLIDVETGGLGSSKANKIKISANFSSFQYFFEHPGKFHEFDHNKDWEEIDKFDKEIANKVAEEVKKLQEEFKTKLFQIFKNNTPKEV